MPEEGKLYSESSSVERGIKFITADQQLVETTGNSRPGPVSGYHHQIFVFFRPRNAPLPVGSLEFIDLDTCTPTEG